jgi:hypothetical protein
MTATLNAQQRLAPATTAMTHPAVTGTAPDGKNVNWHLARATK